MTENTSSPNVFDTHSTKESFNSEKYRFRYTDRKHVDCGQMYVLQRSQANLAQGVGEMNRGKVGSPFVFCFTLRREKGN